MDRLRAYARRELVFLALGTMDVCVITPFFAALLSRIIPVQQLPTMGILLGAVMAVHYLTRLFIWLSLHRSPRSGWLLRSGLLVLGILVSGLLVVRQLLHAHTRLFHPGWLIGMFSGLGGTNLSHDVILFLLVLFLWWRGLVLAQRRLDSESVAFRFRLGLVLLAVTTAVGGLVLPWSHHVFVFIFFFASLVGIALARAEEVGEQYGGSQSPFDLGWLATLVLASLGVLLLSAGVAALLTGENVSRLLGPVWEVLSLVFTVLFIFLVYVIGLLAQVVVMVLRFFLREINLDFARDLFKFVPPELEPQSRQSPFTAEQLMLIRKGGVILGVVLLLVLVVFSLRRLRAKSARRRGEERESVWEGTHLGYGMRDLLRQGRRRLDDVVTAVGHSLFGRFFAARTIRRIYAHMSALAVERGYPRAPYETPYEYLPTLEHAFPDNCEEVACITEAYIAVHYGEVSERLEDLARVQAAWECIRESET